MAIFATPLISYFGSRYNKARIISICNILFSFGCLVFTLPYFFGSRYSINNSPQTQASFLNSSSSLLNTSGLVDLCKSKEVLPLPVDSFNLNISQTREATISEDELMNSTCYRSLVAGQWPIYAFIGGQLLMSWGIAPLFPLGITYICDNLDEHRHSVYTGMIKIKILIETFITKTQLRKVCLFFFLFLKNLFLKFCLNMFLDNLM